MWFRGFGGRRSNSAGMNEKGVEVREASGTSGTVTFDELYEQESTNLPQK
jgi:hypothetical protein